MDRWMDEGLNCGRIPEHRDAMCLRFIHSFIHSFGFMCVKKAASKRLTENALPGPVRKAAGSPSSSGGGKGMGLDRFPSSLDQDRMPMPMSTSPFPIANKCR